MEKKLTVAFLYDFDGTLAPGNMQEHSLLPSIGIDDIGAFWNENMNVAKQNNADPIQTYLYLIHEAYKKSGKKLTRQLLHEHGKDIVFFRGVTEWFPLINAYNPNIEIQHYVISAGLRETIRGTSIAQHLTNVFACDYIYDEEGVALAVGLAVNATNKTQFIFRINKGIQEVYDIEGLNAKTPKENKAIPISQMVYFGDGITDVPAFIILKSHGGYGIAVYDSEKNKKDAEQLLKDERVEHIAPTDFCAGGELMTKTKKMIDLLHTKHLLEETKKHKEC